MKTATIRGVPRAIQRDSWWMDGIERKSGKAASGLPRDMRKPLMLLALIALADAMVWQVVPGLSLAVMSLTTVGAACLMAPTLPLRRAMLAGVTAFFAVAPVIELVQPLSVFLMILGLCLSLCLIAGVGLADLFRAARRYPWVSSLTALHHARSAAQRLSRLGTPRLNLRQALLGWAVPLGLGLVFLLLLTGANPVLEGLFDTMAELEPPRPDAARMAFWAFAGFLIYAALIAHALYGSLSTRKAQRQTVRREGLINAASVTRSLILFNALFAVQTGLDLAFLYGATELPEGMSYATYAHRGAYPLLATALLAGAFAVLARPFTDQNRLLRAALILWLLQTLALVAASVTRLEIYVDVYGLTRLRIAAAIWMLIVAAGLALVIWQVLKRHQTLWMLRRCAILGLSTLYLSAFLNVDATIAWYNLTRDVKLDRFYLCSLSEGAIGPMDRFAGGPQHFCAVTHYVEPRLFTPQDWREWGFRNWRLRTSLAAAQPEEAL